MRIGGLRGGGEGRGPDVRWRKENEWEKRTPVSAGLVGKNG